MLGRVGIAEASWHSVQIEYSLYGIHAMPGLPQQRRIFSSLRCEPHSGRGKNHKCSFE